MVRAGEGDTVIGTEVPLFCQVGDVESTDIGQAGLGQADVIQDQVAQGGLVIPCDVTPIPVFRDLFGIYGGLGRGVLDEAEGQFSAGDEMIGANGRQ